MAPQRAAPERAVDLTDVDYVLDQPAVSLLDDLAGGLERWRAHADEVGLSVAWYGLDHGQQVELYRDVLGAIDRL